MSNGQPLPEYADKLFVNRETEIALVRNKLDKVLDGQTLEKRTTIFTGEHGMGKSWLLRHLQQVLPSPGVVVHYFNLETYRAHPSLDRAIQQVCEDIWYALFGTRTPTPSSLEHAARLLIAEAKQQIPQHRVLMLLIGTVYEALPKFLEVLEDYVLSSFAIEPKVLLVMAGRGREYVFRSPELRLRADFVTVPPFTQTITQKQLQCQLPAKAEDVSLIYPITLGNPKANRLLALGDYSPIALNPIIDEMLAPIQLVDKPLIRAYLEALAIPRRFDYSHAPSLLAAYYDDSTYKQLSRRQVRDIFDKLLNPGLIYWNTTQLAYTIHGSTRNILLQYLKAAQVDRWHRLQLSCVELYRTWVAGKPRNWEQWQVELEHHKNELSFLL